MERWEIGDIASKIGQLYYNYYLRAAEMRFLHESYVFYEAIRSRAYFAQSATDPNLAIKQLRYFARFIIICLLLNRREVRACVCEGVGVWWGWRRQAGGRCVAGCRVVAVVDAQRQQKRQGRAPHTCD
jgi:hypothetical protein